MPLSTSVLLVQAVKNIQAVKNVQAVKDIQAVKNIQAIQIVIFMLSMLPKCCACLTNVAGH